jgi:hypothetical protein
MESIGGWRRRLAGRDVYCRKGMVAEKINPKSRI